MRRSARWLTAAVLAGTSAAPLTAQGFSVSPQIGFYIPTQNLYELANGETYKLEAGPSFGARLGYWFGSRFGIEASGAYIPTTFAFTSAGSQVTSQDAKLFNGSGQAVLYILPRTSPLSLYLSGGVGVVSRGGVAFTDDAESTDVTGVIGAGAGISLGGMALTIGADLFAYNAAYAGSAQTSETFQQRDLQLKLGLGIPFGGSNQLRQLPRAGDTVRP